MKKDGYYSSGQFARMAGVTLRTIRYYDQHDILKPSLVTDAGARFYTDGDFARLQQILLLKYLGFSLEDIQEMTIEDPDSHFMLNALNIQLKLLLSPDRADAAGGKNLKGHGTGHFRGTHRGLEPRCWA